MNTMAEFAARETLAMRRFQDACEQDDFIPVRLRDIKPILEIGQEVAAKYGMRLSQVFAGRGNKRIWRVRCEIYATAYMDGFTLSEIGAALGGRHHATILSGIKKHGRTPK